MAATFQETGDGTTINPDSTSMNPENPTKLGSRTLSSKLRRNRSFTLSPEGAAYKDLFLKLNEEEKKGYVIKPISSDYIETMCIIHPDGIHAVALGFDETVKRPPAEEVVSASYLAFKTVTQKYVEERLKVIARLIVTKEDYGRAAQMFNSVGDYFDINTETEESKLVVSDFADYDIIFTKSPIEINDYLKNHYPHMITPRNNLSLLFETVKKDDKGKRTNDIEGLCLVMGYVDFIVTGGGGNMMQPGFNRYKPLYHFEIFSHNMDSALLSMVMTTIVETYCLNYGWLTQFESFAPDTINLGNLIPMDSIGTPSFAVDYVQRNNVANIYIEPNAQPVINVVHGKVQLPLHNYFNNSDAGLVDFRKRVADFFGAKLEDVPCPIKLDVDKVEDYTGFITNKVTFDSNYIDFLWVIKHNNNINNSLLWRSYYPKREVRGKEMMNMFPNNWRPLYVTAYRHVSEPYVSFVSKMMDEKKLKFSPKIDSGQNFAPAYGNLGGMFGAQMQITPSIRTDLYSNNPYDFNGYSGSSIYF